jgi:pullulanase/glycogen debranching enzyme
MIGYFAPLAVYSAAVRAGHAGSQVAEFKAMVDALHTAGLEVLLDVVFNHTGERCVPIPARRCVNAGWITRPTTDSNGLVELR